MLSLKQLFDKNKCDKSSRHHYDEMYENILGSHRNSDKPFHLLEIGVLRGESTTAWLEYFNDNGKVSALDTFERVPMKDLPESLVNNPRLTLHECDSTDQKQVNKSFGKHAPLFDCIIDDGLHRPVANGASFKNLFPYLKPGGIYVVEDVFPLDIMTKDELSFYWIKRYKEHYSVDLFKTAFMNVINAHDADIESIERVDNRKKSGYLDSYAFVIKKKEVKEEEKAAPPVKKKRAPRKKKVVEPAIAPIIEPIIEPAIQKEESKKKVSYVSPYFNLDNENDDTTPF